MPDQIRVLYVDDESDLLDIGRIFLKSTAGFAVDTLMSAKDALTAIQEQQYDAIISDYQMPKMDGIEFLKAVRASGVTIPFILFTGRGREEIVIQALNEGANFYLQKGGEPISQFAELAHKVRSAVDHRKAENALRESEAKYRSIFETTGAATIIINEDTTIVLANVCFASLSGFSVEELEGNHSWTEFVADEDLERMRRYHTDRRTDANLAPMVYEFQFINRDGSIRYCINNVAMIPGTTMSVASVVDITERRKAEDAVRESERRFRDLSELLPQVIFETDAQGNITYANRVAFNMFGYSPIELEQGLNVLQMIAPEDRDRAMIGLSNIFIGKEPSSQGEEYLALRKDGSSFPISIYNSPIIVNNELAGLRGIIIDMIEYRRATDELMVSQERLRRFMDSATDAFTIWDQKLNLVDLNQAAFAYLPEGTQKEEIIGKNYSELMPGSKDRGEYDKYLEVIQTGVAFSGTEMIPDPQYGKIWLNVNCFRVNEGLGIVTSDITQKKSAEIALRESEEMYRVIFQTTGAATIIFNKDNLIILANAGFAALSGYSIEELEGNHYWTEFVVPEDLERMRTYHHNRLIDTDTAPSVYEFRFIDRDGNIRYGINHVAVIAGTSLCVSSAVDITARKQAEEALKESETLYRSVIDNIQDIYYRSDQEGNLIMVSPSGATLLGYDSIEEMRGKPIAGTFYNDPADRMEILDKLQKSGSVNNFDTRLLKKDGTVVNVSTNSHYYHDKSGAVAGVEGIIRDISERKRMEEELRRSENKFRSIVEATPDMIWEVDPRGYFLYISPQVEAILGFSPDEIMRRSITTLVPTHAQSFVLEEISKHVTSVPGLHIIETPALNKDGRELTIEIRSAPVFDAAGTLIGLRGTAHDITVRKQALSALAESEELFRKLVATIPDLVFRTDLNGIILYANEKAFELAVSTGYDEIIGTSVFQYFTLEDLPLASEKNQVVFERSSGPVEYTLITRDRIRHVIEINGDLLKNPEGTPYGMVFVGRDITQRKKTEGALINANRKLNLLSSITRHDILNKVSIQRGYLALFQEICMDNPEMAVLIEKIESAVRDIGNQIEFTRTYQDLGTQDPQWQDLHQSLTKNPAPPDISVSDSCTGLEIFADLMLKKVLENLIDNAIRHGGNVTTISMKAEEKDGTLVIWLKDNGNGIPDDEKEMIFERGYGKNTGLGLFLVREILAITGISIRETGEEGNGARFEIVVPEGKWRTKTENNNG